MTARYRSKPIVLVLLGGCAAGPDAADPPAATTADAASTTGQAAGAQSTGRGCSGSDRGSSSDGTDAASTAAAGATTGDSDTGAPTLDCSALPLCDDFESVALGGPPDPARWSVTSPDCSGSGALQVTDEVAHGGSHALRVDGGGGYCDHVFFADTDVVAGLGPVVWARMWVRFEAALGDGHVTFAALTDAADGDRSLRMGGQSQILMWNRESDDATLPALSPAGIAESVAPVPGAWTCIEFMIDEAGEIATYVDGAAVAGLRVDTEPTADIDQQWHQQAEWMPDLTDLRFGWESYAGQTMVLYFDDVAVGTDRIGCA